VIFNWQNKKYCYQSVFAIVVLCQVGKSSCSEITERKHCDICNFVFFGSLCLNILTLKALYIIQSLIHTLTFIFCYFECTFFISGRIIVCIFSETVFIQVSEKF
jgi:hypothetical protein